jgi:hypothetical protein
MIIAGFMGYFLAGAASTLFYPSYVQLIRVNLIGLEGEWPSFMQLRYGSDVVFVTMLFSGLTLVLVGVGIGVSQIHKTRAS